MQRKRLKIREGTQLRTVTRGVGAYIRWPLLFKHVWDGSAYLAYGNIQY